MRNRGYRNSLGLICFALASLAFPIGAQLAPSDQRPHSLLSQAEQLRMSGHSADVRRAIGTYREAAEGYRAAGDRRGEASALFGVARAADALSQKREAIKSYSEALPLFRALHDRNAEADILIQLGLDYDYLGDRKRASTYAADALALIGDIQGAARANVL